MRRLLIVTWVLTAAWLSASSYGFGQVRFVPTSQPFQARAGGVTETVGDVVLVVSNPEPVTLLGGTNLTLSLVPAAAVITNTPNVLNVNLQYSRFPLLPNDVILTVGVLPNVLNISFRNPLFLIPGDTLRIRGIRVNVQASGVTSPDRIRVLLSVFPASRIKLDGPNLLDVATVVSGLSVAMGPTASLTQCLAQSVTRSITVTEQAPAVFTDMVQERALSDTPVPTNPTRLEILLTTVPGGLTVQAPVAAPLVAGGVIRTAFLVLTEAPTGCSVATGVCTGPTTRDISLIYNVTGTPDLGQVESATLNFRFITTGVLSTQSLGCAGVQVRLAPLSTTPLPARPGDAGTPRGVVPRFIDPLQPPTPHPLVCVVSCACHLQFPYVTNKDGYDTTLVVSNTSEDPFRTPNQAGTVTFHFYGQDAPDPPRVTVPAVAAGAVFRGPLSQALAPNFDGYVIAIANFQYCSGLALITDSELGTIAHGYTAMAIPDPMQLGGRRAGFPLSGVFIGTVIGATLNGVITLGDALGERRVQ